MPTNCTFCLTLDHLQSTRGQQTSHTALVPRTAVLSHLSQRFKPTTLPNYHASSASLVRGARKRNQVRVKRVHINGCGVERLPRWVQPKRSTSSLPTRDICRWTQLDSRHPQWKVARARKRKKTLRIVALLSDGRIPRWCHRCFKIMEESAAIEIRDQISPTPLPVLSKLPTCIKLLAISNESP